MAAIRVNWVVALRPEAQPLIERFRLNPIETVSGFSIFESSDQLHRLVISGPGLIQSAAATGILAATGLGEEPVSGGWINFGIAGCGTKEFGSVFLASKVSHHSSGSAWYPSSTWAKKFDLKRREVLTVNRPCPQYPEDGALVEMEAAGFYPIALRNSSLEHCHVLKVVSDDPDHPMEAIDKKMVREICEEGLAHGDRWLEAFCVGLEEESERLADPPGFREWIAEVRFSATQTHQLRRLLQQWSARNPEEPFSLAEEKGRADARSVINELRRRLFPCSTSEES